MVWFRETGVGAIVLACMALLTPAVAGAAGPPEIEASWVEDVRDTSAKLSMTVNPNGSSVVYFEYISDAAFLANPVGDRYAGATKTATSEITAVKPLSVSRPTGGALARGTVYHYRPVAKNEAGTTIGTGKLEHIFVTEEIGKAFELPDDRGWEMVSPVDKGGGSIAFPEELFGGGDLQAAAGTASVTYGSATAFGEAVGAPPASQYVSRRGATGWTTENVSTPLDSAAYGDFPDGAPYRVFSADLSRALLFGGPACRGGLEACPAPNPPLAGSGAPDGYMAYYLRDGATGGLSSLLKQVDVDHSAVSPSELEVAFAAAAPDLSHVILSSCAKLTADATETAAGSGSCDPASPNLYEWSSTGLKAVNVLPGDTTSTPGAEIAAPLGAVSQDGSRVYWREGGNLYLREGSSTVQVDGAVGGGGTFQTATPDGAIAFFLKAGHLYRFTAPSAVTDLTPGGGVVGVLGASAGGDYVYFQDASALEVWHAGTSTIVAEGAEAAMPSDYPPATATARVSADGLRLAFLSKETLTAFDNIDANTGQPDVEVYVYSFSSGGGGALLLCASCSPTGERPTGSAAIPGALVNGTARAYRPRALSADGSRLFFEMAHLLSSGEKIQRTDVYEWQANGTGGCLRTLGCVAPLTNGEHGGRFVDASEDGTDVYFLTADSLLKGDPQGSIDLYDARIAGGFAHPEEPLICMGDNCQSLPGEPEDPTPGTLIPNPGNPPLRVIASKKKSKHHKRHRRRRHGQGSKRSGVHAGGRRTGRGAG